MTKAEIVEHFPGAADAVEMCETQSPAGEWEMYSQRGVSPTQVVMWHKQGSEMGQCVARRLRLSKEQMELGERILQQIDSPDFLRYVCGKLGAV